MSAANNKASKPDQAQTSKGDPEQAKKPHVPTPAERALIESFYSIAEREARAPKMKVEQGKTGARIGSQHSDPTTFHAMLANALGTTDADFINAILTQLANATGKGSDASEENLNFVLSVMAGIAPQDRLEAMLAAQMALVHLTAMAFTRRLAHVDTIPQQDSSQNALNKLMRTFTSQMETLKRYRSGAQQTVKVEHVHVHEGGQAIVGNVESGGGAPKSKDQAHAELTHAPEQEMRSAFETDREAVPQQNDEER